MADRTPTTRDSSRVRDGGSSAVHAEGAAASSIRVREVLRANRRPTGSDEPERAPVVDVERAPTPSIGTDAASEVSGTGGAAAVRAVLRAGPASGERGLVQMSPRLGHDRSPAEREAERAADRVALGGPAASPIDIRTRPVLPSRSAAAPASVRAALGRPGRPLEPASRSRMEGWFGHDFGDVRVHDDRRAADAAASIGAAAFAIGRDIVLGHGHAGPETVAGRRLLAHELAHVVQQDGGGPSPGVVQRNRPGELDSTPATTTERDDDFEPLFLTSSQWDEMLRSGKQLRDALGLRVDRIVVVTSSIRVFDPDGERLGRFDVVPGVAISPGIFVLADRNVRLGVRDEELATSGSAWVTWDPERFEHEDDVVTLEDLIRRPDDLDPEALRRILSGSTLLLVAGDPRGGRSEGEIDQGVPSTQGTDSGDGAGGDDDRTSFAPNFTLEDAAGRTYDEPALPAEIRGLELQPVGGSGVYQMNLRYAAAASDQLGQIATGLLPVYYRWEVWDISGAVDAQARSEAVRTGGLAAEGSGEGGRTVGSMQGAARDFERTTERLAERPEQIRQDRDEAVREGRWADVIANELNEELLPLEVIAAYGGSLLSAAADLVGGHREREIPWEREGTYVVRCIAVIDPAAEDDEPMRAPSVATRVVRVQPVETISREAIDRPAADVAELELRLALLEALPEDDPDRAAIPAVQQQIEARRLEAGGTTVDLIEHRLEQARTALARRRDEARVLLEAGFHDSRVFELEQQVRELEDQLGLARDRVSELDTRSGARVRRLRAVLVSRITGQTYPLILQMTEPFIEERRWRCVLSDVTTRDGSIHEGHAELDETDPTGAAYRSVREAVERYARTGPYGPASLTVRLPSTGWFGQLGDDQRVWTGESEARDSTAARARLEELATAVALLGLVVSSPALGVAGGVLGAALAGDRIARRMADGTFRWNDPQTVGDLIEIVGFAASVVGQGARTIGAFRFVEEGDGFVLRATRSTLAAGETAAEATGTTLDVIGTIQADAQSVGDLMAISRAVADGDMTATEARRQRARIIAGAIQSNGLTIAAHARSGRGDAAARREAGEAGRRSGAGDALDGPAVPAGRRRADEADVDRAAETDGPRSTSPGAELDRPSVPDPARMETLRAALGDVGRDVPVVAADHLGGNAVEVVYVDGRLRVEVGPAATARHVAYHRETVRQLARFEGLLGAIRVMMSRVQSMLGIGPGYGDAGFEAGLEVHKLTLIRADLEAIRERIERQSSEVASEREARYREDEALPADLAGATVETIDQEIAAIQAQLDRHLRDLGSIEAGRGRVAMADTTAPPTPVREGDPRFYAELDVGETRLYEEGGGHLGRAARLAPDLTRIEVEIEPGQRTRRVGYQGEMLQRPDIEGFPVGQGGFERLHAVGPVVGHESPYGIVWGSHTLNHYLQLHGIEARLADLFSIGTAAAAAGGHATPLPEGTRFHLTILVERSVGTGAYPGVPFLHSISYRVDIEVPGETGRRGALRMDITVDRPGDPESGFGVDEINLVTGHVASGDFTASTTREGFERVPRSRRRGDILPEHERAHAEQVFEDVRALRAELRQMRTPEASAYADVLAEWIRLVRSPDRMRSGEVENVRETALDILRTFPELRAQFRDAFEPLPPGE